MDLSNIKVTKRAQLSVTVTDQDANGKTGQNSIINTYT